MTHQRSHNNFIFRYIRCFPCFKCICSQTKQTKQKKTLPLADAVQYKVFIYEKLPLQYTVQIIKMEDSGIATTSQNKYSENNEINHVTKLCFREEECHFQTTKHFSGEFTRRKKKPTLLNIYVLKSTTSQCSNHQLLYNIVMLIKKPMILIPS